MRLKRNYIFLKDVFLLTLVAFGGAQAHMALFLKVLVKKRGYLTESELIELNSFCQILPGPASTQTITAVGYRRGGPNLAFLTLLVWILPASIIMTLAAIYVSYLQNKSFSLDFTRFIQPMAVAFVAFAAFKISRNAVISKHSIFVFIMAAVLVFLVRNPVVFPIIILSGGFITAIKFSQHTKEEKGPLNIEWSNLILYGSVFIGAALLGKITDALPIRLFENFFRNGSLIFGGGHILSALFYKEFVVFKHYLSATEFLSGFAILQILPGPLFSFSSFIGALSMRNTGLEGEIMGGLVAMAGIYLPGTLMIFFIIRFWDRLKKYRVVKASFEGINAANAGIVTSTAIVLFLPLNTEPVNYIILVGTFCILFYNKVPAPLIILIGLLAGIII